jgi:hypothetical protein
MARDKTLEERIESTLYAFGVQNSGDIAAAITDEVSQCHTDARAELTLAHALLGIDNEREHTNARHRVQHALDALGGVWPEPKLYDGPVRKP